MVELITPLALIFTGAAVLLFVANRFGLPTIPMYIVAGFGVGLFIPEEQLLDLAQWGIVLLVFVFGVYIEPGRLASVVHDSYPIALIQLAVIGVVGCALGFLLGLSLLDMLYFGIAAALSSSLVGLDLVEYDARRDFVDVRLASSIHFIQDLLAVVFILVLSTAVFAPAEIILQLGLGGVLLISAFIVRRFVFDAFVRLSGGVEELLLLTSISFLMGFIALAEFFGISIVVGAFAAGIAVARDFTESVDMLNGLESLNTFFAAVFFVSLGALVAVPSELTLLYGISLFVLTAAVKPLLTAVLVLYEGYSTRIASQVGFDLDQLSEFTLIIGIEAFLLERIAPELFQAIVLVGAATMVTSSFTHRYHDRLWRTVIDAEPFRSIGSRAEEESHVRDGITDHVILVGFGEQGKSTAGDQTEAVGDACADFGIELVVIDNDPEEIAAMKTGYENYIFGGILDPRTWERANYKNARLIVSTIADREVSEMILGLDTDADTMLTATNADTALELLESGAFYVNVPDILASEQLAEYVKAGFEEEEFYTALGERSTFELRQRLAETE